MRNREGERKREERYILIYMCMSERIIVQKEDVFLLNIGVVERVCVQLTFSLRDKKHTRAIALAAV